MHLHTLSADPPHAVPRSRNHSSLRTGTATARVQEILGKYLTTQEGLTKSFLRLQVESLQALPDDALETFVRFLEPRKLAEGFEVDVWPAT